MQASRQSPLFALGKKLPVVREIVFSDTNSNSAASIFAVRDSENAKEVMETDGAYLTVTAMSRHPTQRSGLHLLVVIEPNFDSVFVSESVSMNYQKDSMYRYLIIPYLFLLSQMMRFGYRYGNQISPLSKLL
jgi:hypothetical protein